MKKLLLAASVSLAMVGGAHADEHSGTYAFDDKGAHQFITFKISHLGYSWLYGRFNDFDGQFTYDAANPENSSVNVTIDTSSVDSNHAERDKHLRSKDFLHVSEYPEASFKSKRVVVDEEGEADIVGDLTLRGVTREVTLDVDMLGHGKDPWGGYRMGFEAETELRLEDFGIPMSLGKVSETVEIIISVEAVRQ
ncbi:MAG: YceI family protein [Marinobacter sp.]|uniref:YceI family protein n=1 Tax=Marinobacter sp. TaxID=50741 RepID=UPI001B7535C0|nr:YceI family protein [Marinobacter sp.]MBQ0744988.1 YceI family protein [Marinobacter sp.]MBQ0814088.1 YceI family protein [Marinobacter sp.]|tara:strand:+ start:6832 stop:7413 length:582 start_codon:yes stop_codon:yes gene_type:complete